MMTSLQQGYSVFLVEDEVMIRMMVADMLEELGHSIAGEAGEIGHAIKLAQSTEFELAILDVNVNGHMITPVAEADKGTKSSVHFRDRLRRGRRSCGISRSTDSAETISDRKAGGEMI